MKEYCCCSQSRVELQPADLMQRYMSWAARLKSEGSAHVQWSYSPVSRGASAMGMPPSPPGA
eukprot:3238688-Heterocapsa_arctica.AAC.1